MLFQNYFYNRTIRKIVVTFGSLFNQISIVRKSNDQSIPYEHYKVPLVYGPKEKYLTRITTDPTLTKSIATTVPRMSFEMTGLSYDANRKQQTMMQKFGSATSGITAQYSPIPYDFEFVLSVYVRNTEDGTQIIEQILPFFTPDYTLTVRYIDGLPEKYDVPIILNSVTNTNDYEGDMLNTRLILWDLTFTVKGFIFPAIRNEEVIRTSKTNVYIDPQMGTVIQKAYVSLANGHGSFAENETVRVANTGLFGTVMTYSTSSPYTGTATLTIKDANKILNIGDVLVGDDTNSSRVVTNLDSLYSGPIVTAQSTVVTDPVDSEPNDDFGYTETIAEYPNIP